MVDLLWGFLDISDLFHDFMPDTLMCGRCPSGVDCNVVDGCNKCPNGTKKPDCLKGSPINNLVFI